MCYNSRLASERTRSDLCFEVGMSPSGMGGGGTFTTPLIRFQATNWRLKINPLTRIAPRIDLAGRLLFKRLSYFWIAQARRSTPWGRSPLLTANTGSNVPQLVSNLHEWISVGILVTWWVMKRGLISGKCVLRRGPFLGNWNFLRFGWSLRKSSGA